MVKKMENKKKIAIDYFKSGLNCAQSTILSFKEMFDLQEEDLIKISSSFGGGMGRLQNTCGAVTGAYIAIGLKYGKNNINSIEEKEKIYSLVRKFDLEFKKLNKTTICRELLGCNLLTKEGNKYFTDNDLTEKICNKCIEDSIKILNKILNNTL